MYPIAYMGRITEVAVIAINSLKQSLRKTGQLAILWGHMTFEGAIYMNFGPLSSN